MQVSAIFFLLRSTSNELAGCRVFQLRIVLKQLCNELRQIRLNKWRSVLRGHQDAGVDDIVVAGVHGRDGMQVGEVGPNSGYLKLLPNLATQRLDFCGT